MTGLHKTDDMASWDRVRCTSWCVVDHAHQIIHADDRRHESAVRSVPAVVLGATAAPEGKTVHRAPESAEIFVSLQQRFDDQETWVAIAHQAHELNLSLESAWRLHRALGEVLSGACGHG